MQIFLSKINYARFPKMVLNKNVQLEALSV